MSVITNFSYCITSGNTSNPPFDVDFTDTSTGSPDSWWWDFGDGHSSDSQSPSHTYESAGEFNVTLTSWKNASINTHVVSAFAVGGRDKGVSGSDDWDDLWIEFGQKAWGSSAEQRFVVGQSGGTKTIDGGENIYRIDLTSEPNSFLNLLIARPTAGNWEVFGSAAIRGNALKITLPLQHILFSEMVDNAAVALIGISGAILDFTITDAEDFSRWANDPDNPGTIGYQSTSIGNLFQVESYTSADWDSISKTVVSLVTSFTGVPLVEKSPLSVVFTDTTSGGTPDSWSWKRRVSGSGDSFVEFSTDQNPTEIFDEDDPTP